MVRWLTAVKRAVPFVVTLDLQLHTLYTQPALLSVGVICAAPMYSGWYRAQVCSYDEDTDECDIKFVDYGGYLRVKSSVLRQIRCVVRVRGGGGGGLAT